MFVVDGQGDGFCARAERAARIRGRRASGARDEAALRDGDPRAPLRGGERATLRRVLRAARRRRRRATRRGRLPLVARRRGPPRRGPALPHVQHDDLRERARDDTTSTTKSRASRPPSVDVGVSPSSCGYFRARCSRHAARTTGETFVASTTSFSSCRKRRPAIGIVSSVGESGFSTIESRTRGRCAHFGERATSVISSGRPGVRATKRTTSSSVRRGLRRTKRITSGCGSPSKRSSKCRSVFFASDFRSPSVSGRP